MGKLQCLILYFLNPRRRRWISDTLKLGRKSAIIFLVFFSLLSLFSFSLPQCRPSSFSFVRHLLATIHNVTYTDDKTDVRHVVYGPIKNVQWRGYKILRLWLPTFTSFILLICWFVTDKFGWNFQGMLDLAHRPSECTTIGFCLQRVLPTGGHDGKIVIAFAEFGLRCPVPF